ncbi:two component transcriptional regulator, LuxR family [Granulicella pectinivorans]|uniref:Two component transcriptional regulator, LuxR family n=1 Tax=Granulicella pectinivorans TaxID=474950 RepID=A0A1I6M5S6_9BACT|nr:response regulator transcription factor [Granulicella pectinivorans]SFS11021.1 two component transcriptional regulator, LuxR family [Granulicella pectinivorans]
MSNAIEAPIRLLIVDDHPVVCAGLTSMLSAQPGIQVAGSAATGQEALAILECERPDLILLDLRMPGMDGVSMLHALKELETPPRVVVLTNSAKEEDIYRAIRAGAQGYLLKDTPESEMVAAIFIVMQGKRYIPRHIAARLADRMMKDDLTGRELEILELLAQGLTNKQIGKDRNISDNTVRNHVNNIMEKLGVSDRTEAVASAIRSGVLAESD